MKIGSKYKFSDVQARHWEQFSKAAGLSPAQARRRILELASQLPAHAKALHARFSADGLGDAVLQGIVELIEKRCELTVRRLGGIGA
jgi:serine/threonine-protein kinase HipA